MNHHPKRNMLLLFLDNLFFTNAMTFLAITSVIAYFLSTLGASTFEIGLSNSLVSIGAFVSQPIFARKVMNLHFKQRTFVKILLSQRIFFLLTILFIPFLAKSNPHLMVLVFLCCWGIFNFFTGSYGPFYTSLFAKMVAEQHRGRLKGFAGATGNAIALISAVLVGLLLKDVPYPYNYTVIFTIGTILLIVDALDFAFMKETPDEISHFNLNYFQYFKAVPSVLRDNKAFRKIVLGFSFMLISQVTLAYDAVYAVKVFHANGPQIAALTGITAIVNIVGSLVLGVLADRFSHRMVLTVSALLGGLSGVLPLLMHNLFSVYASFALTTLCVAGYNLSSGVLIIETVDRQTLPMCVSVNTLITLITSSVVTMGSSFVIGAASFAPVFIIAMVSGFISCLLLWKKRPGITMTKSVEVSS